MKITHSFSMEEIIEILSNTLNLTPQSVNANYVYDGQGQGHGRLIRIELSQDKTIQKND
jgi:hypothetical protein